MAPGVVRGPAPAAGPGGGPAAGWRPATLVHDLQGESGHRLAVAALTDGDLLAAAAGQLDHPQRGVAAFVRDVGDPAAVMRPPGRRRVEVAVGERKGVAAVARHQPQLVPLAAEVGAVDDAFAVGGPVGARLPGRLLVAQLARRGHASRARRHAPEPARAVDVPAIRDEDDLAAVRRPRWRQAVVPAAVVVARQAAVVVVGDPLHPAGIGPAQREREDVPALVVARGDERDAGAVRGPAWLEGHGPN